MGLFDELTFEGHPVPRCPQGHEVRKGFQTKDFECWLDHYVIRDGMLGMRESDFDGSGSLKSTDRVSNCDFTGLVLVYAACAECPDTNVNPYSMGFRAPLLDWNVDLVGGRVTAIDDPTVAVDGSPAPGVDPVAPDDKVAYWRDRQRRAAETPHHGDQI